VYAVGVSDVRLHLLRHAHAGDPAKWDRPDDDRPLSARGVRQSERLAGLLVAGGFQTDAVVTSPLVRAEQTARIVAEALGLKVRIDDRLAPGFDLDALVALHDDLGRPGSLVLVGHDPDFSELLGDLLGAPLVMRKGALARVDVATPIEVGTGSLRWLIPPDALAAKG
jgi:phosphohistidine phosphatase